jgi:chemotaxis methyl-accepting protein methylase
MKTSQIGVQAVANRLRGAIGVDPRGLDPSRLLWIIESRCRELKLPSHAAYAAFLDEVPGEIDALIEEAVVRETRFFRDPTVFEHVRRTLFHLAAVTPGQLRILSAPCGTGEEVYSVAAMLQLAGIVPARFTIDAFDISAAGLEIARAGIYPDRAFSHVAPDLRQACVSRSGKQWKVHDALRERVHFARRNLAQRGALGDTAQYHLVLCRNLFIYLAPEARAALAESLATALLPGGRLFLGTADRVEELAALFAPMRPASSFEFVRRAPAGTAAHLEEQSVPTVVSAPFTNPKPLPKRQSEVAQAAALRPVLNGAETSSLPAAEELLKRAVEHRQLGEIAKAERRCRQALYLAPNLLPALELLQSLWSDHPNLRQRRALRDRVLRNRVLWLAQPAGIEEGA